MSVPLPGVRLPHLPQKEATTVAALKNLIKTKAIWQHLKCLLKLSR
jgi:hypothetical protein